MSKYIPDLEDINKAHKRIKPYIHRTPIFSSLSVNHILGAETFFKCENLQKTGAFKFRGATNAVMSLKDEDLIKGVATHSSGNHAAALTKAASLKSAPAYIVMPDNAPKIKKDAVKGYGGLITFCEPTLEARESNLEKVVDKTGAKFIHPYDNSRIIEGQGTAAIELLQEIEGLDIVMAPVGGGGLLSGTSIAVKGISPETVVLAAEPANADDAFRSFKKGELIPSINPNTIADGLLTSLSELTFTIIRKNVEDILTVSEDSIVAAMRLIWERMKLIIEPSSAVPVAAIMENPSVFRNRRVGVIVSGGNVDLEKLQF